MREVNWTQIEFCFFVLPLELVDSLTVKTSGSTKNRNQTADRHSIKTEVWRRFDKTDGTPREDQVQFLETTTYCSATKRETQSVTQTRQANYVSDAN